MLGRHIVSYLPSQIIPALTALAAITIYTHLMSTQEYGYYSLMISGHMLVTIGCFSWVHGVILRLAPKAVREGYGDALRTTTYTLFGGIALVAVVLVAGWNILSPHSDVAWIVWFALGLGLARSLLNMHECWHRGLLRIQRYNLLECGQAVIGLIISVALVCATPYAARGAAIGLLSGMLLMALVDHGEYRGMKRTHVRRPVLAETLHIGLPLIFSNVLVFILTSSDRFLVGYFAGASAVGVYAAGYTLVDRIMQVLFMAISMASYSLTIHRLEHEGVEAARVQTYRNGIGILALTVPACVGLIFCAPQLAAVVIGEEFREGALKVMPWITAASFFSGLATHYFDHVFAMAKKTYLLFFTQGPGALLNIVLNLTLIPRYGAIGAAYATLGAYMLLLMLSIIIGRRAFKIHFPVKPALQVAAATALMALVLSQIDVPLNLVGLIAMAVIGAGVYGLAVLALNLEGTRPAFRHVLGMVWKLR